jgi:hypothetical protein
LILRDKNSGQNGATGVFSEQLENPGFKVPMLFGLLGGVKALVVMRYGAKYGQSVPSMIHL